MKEPSNFKKSNFYIFLVCNYWTFVSSIELLSLIGLTTVLYCLFHSKYTVIFYVIQFILGLIYFAYTNYGMILNYPKRKKMYKTITDSIDEKKPIKRSIIYAMMLTKCEKHIIHIIEKNYGIKLT